MRAIVATRISAANRNATKGGFGRMNGLRHLPDCPECRLTSSLRESGEWDRADEAQSMTMDSKDIRAEADDILRSGLRSILGRHGEVHMVGSYVLGLMTWRDLDIHVVREDLDVRTFFDLGGEIAGLMKPHRMHFRDESTVGTPGLPRGFYWGIYLGDERSGAWKIDIWQTHRQAFELERRFLDDLSARLNDTNGAVILEIKAACWRHPQTLISLIK